MGGSVPARGAAPAQAAGLAEATTRPFQSTPARAAAPPAAWSTTSTRPPAVTGLPPARPGHQRRDRPGRRALNDTLNNVGGAVGSPNLGNNVNDTANGLTNGLLGETACSAATERRTSYPSALRIQLKRDALHLRVVLR